MTDKQKLVCCIMGQNCEKFIGMCLESVKDAEGIVYCDGGSKDNLIEDLYERGFLNYNISGKIRTIPSNPRWLIQNSYDQEDKQMNGKQRNFYLNFLKTYYPNDWALCIDADEVVEDLSKIKEFIQTARPTVYSVKMRHFIGDFGHEDATTPEHFVPHRLFKISEASEYTLTEHSVLQPVWRDNKPEPDKNTQIAFNGSQYALIGSTRATVIWHLAYAPNMWDIKKRYETHIKKSEMHTPEFLHDWYLSHLFGKYPKTEVNPIDIPDVILKEFLLNKDEFYFNSRAIELKHPLMVHQWNQYFNPISVLDLGCGRGVYLYFWRWFVMLSFGIELSPYAIKTAFVDGIKEGNIANSENYTNYDLITAIDVLEHLDDDDLDKTLTNISNSGKKFIFSIPFIGDPNLESDKGHKQKHTRDWWEYKIKNYGIKIMETPADWLYANQIIIGVKNE